MSAAFFPSIVLNAKVSRPIPEKEILWGDQYGGRNRFPENIQTVKERRFAENPKCLNAFGKAISESVERVWIVDEYLFMPDLKSKENSQQARIRIQDRITAILQWFPLHIAASDIRFLTKLHEEILDDELNLFDVLAQDINRHSSRRDTQCNIEIRTHLTQEFDFVHDRFAIIDDELWHFGGTVGGFHTKVSAASRGWRASDHGAIDFFKMAWDAGQQK